MITRAPTIDQSDMDFVYEEEREAGETVQLSNMTGESQKCLRKDSDLKWLKTPLFETEGFPT